VALVIGKFSCRHFKDDDVLWAGSMDDRIADQLRSDIESRRNILLRGVIETGETTLQQAFGNFIPSGERAFLIKDASEIHIGHNR
jgi:Flp pilus assembly CpaF family ATPase